MRVRVTTLLALLVPCTLRLAAQRAIADTDLYAFHWVAGPQVSPDGKQVAYVLVTVNAKRDGYETRIWTVATDGKSAPRRLTAGPHDAAPRWSPDSKRWPFSVQWETTGRSSSSWRWTAAKRCS